MIEKLNCVPYVILIGDLNARTGMLPDYSIDDSFKNLPIEVWYIEDNFNMPRILCDPNEKSKNFGRALLWLCQVLDIHIVNGRTAGDPAG